MLAPMWTIVTRLVWLVLVGLTAPRAVAQTPVDLELVLAVDVSLSMDLDEQRLQRDGYVGALRDAGVKAAISSGGQGRIALTYMEWAGPGTEKVVVPWTVVDAGESIERFADRLAAAPITRARMTSISNAMTVAAGLFAQSGAAAPRRVLDISGDGPNNAGRLVVDARDELLAKGIVINGLPIMLKRGSAFGYFDIDKLEIYYEACVIGGTGSFVIPVREAAEFAPAIRRKLMLEISGIMELPRIVPTQARVGRPDAIDCEIGEKMRRRYFDEDFPR